MMLINNTMGRFQNCADGFHHTVLGRDDFFKSWDECPELGAGLRLMGPCPSHCNHSSHTESG